MEDDVEGSVENMEDRIEEVRYRRDSKYIYIIIYL